jgi:hypothetical protein
MTIYEALDVISNYYDFAAATGFFDDEELIEIGTAEHVIRQYVKEKENVK